VAICDTDRIASAWQFHLPSTFGYGAVAVAGGEAERRRAKVMNKAIDQGDEADRQAFDFLVTDEALEAAANTTKDTIFFTLPGGVSINVTCCSDIGG
jgi:hypothetical protein